MQDIINVNDIFELDVCRTESYSWHKHVMSLCNSLGVMLHQGIMQLFFKYPTIDGLSCNVFENISLITSKFESKFVGSYLN